ESSFRLWNAATGEPVKEFSEQAGTVAFSDDGKTLASIGWREYYSKDQGVSLWDVTSTKRIKTLQAPTLLSPTNGRIAFLPGQPTLLACDYNARLTVWDVEAGKFLHEYVKDLDQFPSIFHHCLHFAPSGDGRTIAVNNKDKDGPIVLWDARTGK